jgi:hypothetical protein
VAGHAGIGGGKVSEVDALREAVDDSYVSRMVNLTSLALDIVAAILDETLPAEVTPCCGRVSGGD